MTENTMTMSDVVEATLWSWGADTVTPTVSLARLVRHVLADPTWLVRFAEAVPLPAVEVEGAKHLARLVAAGIQPDTVDGRRWFLPGAPQ